MCKNEVIENTSQKQAKYPTVESHHHTQENLVQHQKL